VIISAYIDESGTHGGPTMLMACLVGRLGQWSSFDPKWRKYLRRYGLTYYHSKEMKHSEGEFKGWTIAKKYQFASGAAKLTEKHTMFGMTTVLREDDYSTHYIANDRPKEVQLDSSYGLCFRFTLARMVEIIRHTYGDRGDIEIDFVLESGHRNFGDAERIFKLVKKQSAPEVSRILRSIRSGGKKEPGLQAADAGAYHMLGSELKRTNPPGTITIPSPVKGKPVRRSARWLHYNFMLSGEKIAEFRAEIMSEVEAKRKRRDQQLAKRGP
jgi:hypothetical protein